MGRDIDCCNSRYFSSTAEMQNTIFQQHLFEQFPWLHYAVGMNR